MNDAPVIRSARKGEVRCKDCAHYFCDRSLPGKPWHVCLHPEWDMVFTLPVSTCSAAEKREGEA